MDLVQLRQTVCSKTLNILYILVVLLGFVVPLSTALTSVLSIILLVTWIFYLGLSFNLNTLERIYENKVSYYFLLFLSLYVVGILWSYAPFVDVKESLIKMTKFLCLPIIISISPNKKWRQRIYFAFMLAATITLFVQFSRYVMLGSNNPFYFKDPIFTSLVLSLYVYFLFEISKQYKKIKYLCYFLIGLTCIYMFIDVLGRTGQLILIALVIYYIRKELTFKKLCIVVTGIIISLTCLYNVNKVFHCKMYFVGSELISFANNEKMDVNGQSIGARLVFWQNSINHIVKKPYLGWGTGSFKSEYKKSIEGLDTSPADNPHNEYINIFFQFGLLGFVGFIVLLGIIYFNSKKLEGFDKVVASGLLIALIIGCGFNSWLMDFTSGYMFSIFFGTCFAALKLREQRC